MARLAGDPTGPGFLGRLVYRAIRRRLGRVPLPTQIAALQPPIFFAHARMEAGQQKADALPVALKRLVQVRVAARVGCPF